MSKEKSKINDCSYENNEYIDINISLDSPNRALSRAVKTLLREKQFTHITVEEICHEAGVSRRNFYRYFPDKYDLLNWMYYDEFCKAINDRHIEHTLELLPFVCNHLYTDRALYKNAFDVKGQNSFREYCKQRLHPYFVKDYGESFPNETIRDFFIDHIIDALFDGFQIWLSETPCRSAEEYSDYLTKTITRFALRFAEIAIECNIK